MLPKENANSADKSNKDALLINTTHDDWENITRPRVQGAWNLHETLPDLDFFIALSSLPGIMGNIGQSIYAGTAVSGTTLANPKRNL